MNKIFSSATKTVFVLMAIATIILTFRGVITGEQFMSLIVMVFMAYYKSPQSPSQG
jgi:hypothetical protein